MKFPAVFVNHGGGPLPLLGRQPELAHHMKTLPAKWLPPEEPKSILLVSAYWESDPVQILGSRPNPHGLYFDYSGLPTESFEYKYPAPGSPDLANQVQTLLTNAGIEPEFNTQRGLDHGAFVPLMLMYPEADIPVVSVSLHSSLDADTNLQIGRSLSSLRDDGVLILGSGYTYHNMPAFSNPSPETYQASTEFNDWLTEMIQQEGDYEDMLSKLQNWEKAPGARIAHPREEHLLPLLVTAAAGGEGAQPKVIFAPEESKGNHAVCGYLFN